METPIFGRITRRPASDDDWWNEAACQGMNTEMFFMPPNVRGVEKARRIRVAKRVCSGCQVLDWCRAEAHRMHEMHGVWGGEDEETRRFLLSRTSTHTQYGEEDHES